MRAMSDVLQIRGLCKSFGPVRVLRDVSLSLGAGRVLGLCGENGAGKSTLMRCATGALRPDAGEIRIDGDLVSSRDVLVPPEERGIGMVFQSYAVWPHMNVFDNVAYPLKIRKRPKEEIREKVERILEIVHLSSWDGPLSRSPGSCCWTSRSPIWTRSSASGCGLRSRRSRKSSGSMSSMSPMTRVRR